MVHRRLHLFALLIVLLGLGCVCLPQFATAKTYLDLSVESHLERVLDASDRTAYVFEIGIYLGLSKSFWDVLTFSGHLGPVYAGQTDGPWLYAFRNQQNQSTYHVWGIAFEGEVWLHWPQALWGVIGGIHGRSFFMPTRSGIFRIDAYVGVASRLPFGSVLHGAVFSVRYYFSLVDDFMTVFQIDHQAPSLSFLVTFQF